VTPADPKPSIGIVAIGRNEGARLAACLASLKASGGPIVYVDSGSTDDSVAIAQAAEATVVALDMSVPFTAARARNAGFEALSRREAVTFVQFVDGDCEVEPGWIDAAAWFLAAHPDVVAVCGRRRERHPDATLYNRLCDSEWDTPVGPALETGGDVLIRSAAFREVGGFNPVVIAGEEPELAARLRARGWRLWRIDQPMTVHDANMTTFRQWWTRSVRAGHAYAEVSWLHRGDPQIPFKRGLVRCVAWAGVLPLAILVAGLVHPAAFAGILVYPLQVARIAVKRGAGDAYNWRWAGLNMLAKFAELWGAFRFARAALLRRQRRLIEYR